MLTVCVLAFGIGLIALRWDAYGEVIAQADPAWLALGVAFLLAGNLVSTWLSAELLAARGTTVPPVQMARIVLVPNVVKYVPGFVAQAAAYYSMARKAGIDRRGVLLLWVEVMWLTLTVTSALGSLALLATGSGIPAWIALTVLAGSVVVLIPWVRDWALRMARILPDDRAGLGRLNARPLVIASIGVALLGAHGIALARGVGSDLNLLESVAAFAGGWVVGLLAFVFPGGIGPRELVASMLLAEFTSPTVAVVLVIMSRFATILADVIAGATVLLVPSSNRSPRAGTVGANPSTAKAPGG